MRVRLVAVRLQVEAVSDDGETLTPLGLQPLTLTAGQWPTFDMGAYLAEVTTALDRETPPAAD